MHFSPSWLVTSGISIVTDIYTNARVDTTAPITFMSQSKLKARIEGPVQMHIPSCRYGPLEPWQVGYAPKTFDVCIRNKPSPVTYRFGRIGSRWWSRIEFFLNLSYHTPNRKSSADWRALNLTAARFRRSAWRECHLEFDHLEFRMNLRMPYFSPRSCIFMFSLFLQRQKYEILPLWSHVSTRSLFTHTPYFYGNLQWKLTERTGSPWVALVRWQFEKRSRPEIFGFMFSPYISLPMGQWPISMLFLSLQGEDNWPTSGNGPSGNRCHRQA